MARLIKRTGEKTSLWQKIKSIALSDVGTLVRGLDQGSLERLEELLLAADFGVASTMRLVDYVENLARQGKIKTEQQFLDSVQREITSILTAGNSNPALNFAASGPTVFLMVGVNGVGKTTTIGKLARFLVKQRRRVLLAAGDTFRAGAIDQLEVWAQRSGAEFVGARAGADPAAVAFDAIDAAQARGANTVIVDTAGRLHTQGDLMTELGRCRVSSHARSSAPTKR
jgi:fused signal recognition particle receptor